MLNKIKQQLAIKGNIVLTVRVHDNAKKTAVKGVLTDGSLKLDIAAPAADNKANREIIKFLGKEFGVGREGVKIISGQTSRIKLCQIKNTRL